MWQTMEASRKRTELTVSCPQTCKRYLTMLGMESTIPIDCAKKCFCIRTLLTICIYVLNLPLTPILSILNITYMSVPTCNVSNVIVCCRGLGGPARRGGSAARAGLLPVPAVLAERRQRVVRQVQGHGAQAPGPHRGPLPGHIQGPGNVIIMCPHQYPNVLRAD